MINLAQWQQIRRVDHAHLGIVNPRTQAHSADAPDLKDFDADVDAYGRAHNNFDRVSSLGRIMQRAKHATLQNREMPSRYMEAISQLYHAAEGELNNICPSDYGPARRTDLFSLSDGLQMNPRRVQVNVIYLTPAGSTPNVGTIDATINDHLNAANNVYQAAGISIVRTNPVVQVVSQTPTGESILLANVPEVPAQMQGKFAAQGRSGERLIQHCNQPGPGANTIDVVYVSEYDENDVQGKTYRAGAEYAGGIPNRPIVTVRLTPPAQGAATHRTTLAHELGHALTGEENHSSERGCLMASGPNRTAANTLSDGHIVWLRHNSYARAT